MLFLSRGGGHTLFLTRDEAVLGALRMRFERRSALTSLIGADPLPGTVNYFKGNARSWLSMRAKQP